MKFVSFKEKHDVMFKGLINRHINEDITNCNYCRLGCG